MTSKLCRDCLVLILVLAVVQCAVAESLAVEQQASKPSLAFAALRWQGKYRTKDIPGGVEVSPNQGGAIYTIEGDGARQTKIVDIGGVNTVPQFSADGQWIYFQSDAKGLNQICRCRPDGTDLQNLTEIQNLGSEWTAAQGCFPSRDGTKLVFCARNTSISRVAVANADGTQAAFVAPKLGYTYMAKLNSNGSQVAFSGPAGGYRLFVVDLPDGVPRLITPDHPESFVPQYTPDDKTIVFTRRDGDIYRVDADGQDLRRLTNGNQYYVFKFSDEDHHGSTDAPSISPDGRQIAYVALKDGLPQVCTMNIDGSNQRQITHRPTPCARVQWSPDGSQLAFVSFEGTYPQLFTIAPNGENEKCLTKFDDAGVLWYQWHP